MKDSYNIGLQELEDKAQEFIRLMYGMAERQLLESTQTPPTARESALASAAQACNACQSVAESRACRMFAWWLLA